MYRVEVFDCFIERRGKDVKDLLIFLVTIIYQHMKGCITSNHNINGVYHGNAIGSMNKCWMKTAKKNTGSLTF